MQFILSPLTHNLAFVNRPAAAPPRCHDHADWLNSSLDLHHGLEVLEWFVLLTANETGTGGQGPDR
jgi:hypothetical protein